MIRTNKEKNAVLAAAGVLFHNDDFVIPDEEVTSSPVKSELEKVVYAVNPLTGFPDNDLRIMNDSNVSPTLRQAIHNANHVVSPVGPSSFDDDAVLDSQQQPYESDDEYLDRLQENAQKLNKDTEE